MDRVFLDTDVVIDFLIDRQPHAHYSSLLFDLSEKGKLIIFISSLSVNNIHYIIKKILGDKKAKEVIADFITLVEVQGVDKRDIVSALESDIKDFEDAIQHCCAFNIKNLKAIITRNTKDYKKSKIAVFTPEVYLKTIDNKH